MNLNEERKLFLIERLALKDPLTKVKEEYTRLFEEKITGEDLIRFQHQYKPAIEAFAKKELNNVRKEPLAHVRIRLRALNDALTYAMTPRATKSVPVRAVGKEIEYQVTYEPDYTAITNIVKAAQNEEFFVKKLFLDVKKLQLTQDDLGANGESGFDIIPVDAGLKSIEVT